MFPLVPVFPASLTKGQNCLFVSGARPITPPGHIRPSYSPYSSFLSLHSLIRLLLFLLRSVVVHFSLRSILQLLFLCLFPFLFFLSSFFLLLVIFCSSSSLASSSSSCFYSSFAFLLAKFYSSSSFASWFSSCF